jgi:ubiquinone biosynthesis protein Coq4
LGWIDCSGAVAVAFCGPPQKKKLQLGGKTAAIMMSLIQTAAAAGVNVKLYMRDVLQRIATESDVKKLLPHGWKQHFERDVEGRRNEIIELLVKSRG